MRHGLGKLGKLTQSPGRTIVTRSYSNSIRALLSGAGQTAYDAASTDSFFAVSSTDWDAVVAGIASTSKLGPSDANFVATSGGAFSANYLFTADQTLATVPANNYIIGFRAVTQNTSSQWKIYGGPTFKSTSPVYSQISTTSPSTGASTGTFYYLRKAPTVQSATTYIAVLATQTMMMTPNGSYLTPVAGPTSSAYTSGSFTTWSNWVDRLPKVQVLITPTAVT